MSRETLSNRLRNGIRKLQLEVSDAQVEQLMTLHEQLVKWNKTYNLTAIRDEVDMIDLHLLDSLSIASHIGALVDANQRRIIDVGTGAGFPGLPMAILYPQGEFFLLDSNGKKTRFVEHAAALCGLPNVTVLHERAERHQPAIPYNGFVCRAYSSMDTIVAQASGVLADDGVILAMKGTLPDDEITALPPGWQVTSAILEVPNVDGQRHMITLRRK